MAGFINYPRFSYQLKQIERFPTSILLQTKPFPMFHELFCTILLGYISVSEWCKAMETATDLGLPWRMLRDKLVALDSSSGKVKYSTTFDKINATDISVSNIKIKPIFDVTSRHSTFIFLGNKLDIIWLPNCGKSCSCFAKMK